MNVGGNEQRVRNVKWTKEFIAFRRETDQRSHETTVDATQAETEYGNAGDWDPEVKARQLLRAGNGGAACWVLWIRRIIVRTSILIDQ